MTIRRLRSAGRLLLAGAVVAVVAAPAPARADGPGYGGTADALTVRWADPSAALAVYAVGFRAGSAVHLRVGAAPEQTVTADPSGALRLVVGAVAGVTPDTTVLPMPEATTGRLSPGTSVLVAGRTPTGALRTLVGAVPPPAASKGPADVVPLATAAALLGGGGVIWVRRRRPALVTTTVHRYRHQARHRA